jgi:hypothetical protein
MRQKTGPPMCVKCGQQIDFYLLDKKVDKLKELSADDFNICHKCLSISKNTCYDCEGAVYIPQKFKETSSKPDICPDCRHTRWEQTGEDPGWILNQQISPTE